MDGGLIIDFDLNEHIDEEMPRTLALRMSEARADIEAKDSAQIVRVACESCHAELGPVAVGPPEGVLGLICTRRAYWCPRDERLVSVNRLLPSEERHGAATHLGDMALKRPVSLKFAFEVASMT